MEKISPSIEKLAESHGNIVAYRVAGKLTIEDIKEAHEDMLELMDRHKKLKLVIDIQSLQSMEPSAILEDLKFTLHYLNDFSAIAIVGEKKWQETLAKFSDAITHYNVRFFEPSQLEKALAWIEES
jgi:chromosome condensin MukBEF MukE localization factor